VKFIGHAQAWWAHIDKNHKSGSNYPKGLETPGGITDRLLSDYPADRLLPNCRNRTPTSKYFTNETT
jgi:hypothetical protein